MSEPRRFAVLLVRNDTSQTPPPIDDCRKLLSSGQWSVARYWSDNSEDWFQFAGFDYFGWYDVQLPPKPGRSVINQHARDAASAAGVNLGAYDSFIVMVFPGIGLDAGADGIGPGHTATLNSTCTHTFMCHEVGHVLGFNHTFGIPNSGSDWSDDGIAQLSPLYGDPYDLMSAETFGGASPIFSVPESEDHAGFPRALSAGPMVSRALLHYTRPMALESAGKVRHETEGGTNEIITIFPAGSGETGKPELFVYHPLNEDGGGRGRVYVEYRQPDQLFFNTRWDKGLPSSGDSLCRTGIIVHVVKDDPGTGSPFVWYAGRITFPNADTDVQVDTPFGPVTVSVSPDWARQDKPLWVPVRITKGAARRGIMLNTPMPTDTVAVLSSEKRAIPGWEFLGEFTWERRATTRTAQYIAITSGFGGGGSADQTKTVTLRWFVGNNMCMGASGSINLLPSGGTHSVHVRYAVDEARGILTLTNDPIEGAYVVDVSVEAYDALQPISTQTSTTARSEFDAPGIEEGWGEDHKAFMRWMYHITHPIPKWRPGPPPIGDIRDQIDEMTRALTELERVRPGAARMLNPIQVEFERDQLAIVPQLSLQPHGRPVVTRNVERVRQPIG
jgi:hypothetical protein